MTATEEKKPFADFGRKQIGRRSLLRKGAILGASLPAAGGLLVAGCYDDPSGRRAEPTPKPAGKPATEPSHDGTTHNSGSTGGAVTVSHTADEMDAHHEEGIKQFLENMKNPITQGKGNLPLEWTMDGDTKVFALSVDEFDWETTPGNFEQARGYNGMVPGPIIRATEGERVRIVVTNNLQESTAVHWHGLYVPNDQDGVPFITQLPIKPGATYTYEFTLRNWGTHMYHSHHNAMEQTNRGLLGAFIIDPADPSKVPAHDIEYTMVLNDTLLGFTINGKGFPATEAIVAKKGQKLLLRYMNEGEMIHPMHLHGVPQQVIAIDGWPLASPYMCDTVPVAPGNRYDVLVDCTEEGIWAFHCHVLSHAESKMGMYGMVTVLVIEP